MYWLDPIGGVSSFEDHPIFIHENAAGTHIRLPGNRRTAGRCEVAFARNGIACAPDTIDRVVHEREISEIRTRVAELLPTWRASACTGDLHVLNTPDLHFVIGRHPQCADIIWRADSPGTASNSFPSSARSLPTWPSIATPTTPSRCSTRRDCRPH
jgi:sarcosine oxidase